MEFKIFLKNYYRKSPKLLLYSSLVIFLFLFGCSAEEKKVQPELPKTYETISYYPSGKPKDQNIFVTKNGKKEAFGFQELHENGQVKMIGAQNSEGKRIGLWESFYEDGKPWSIGEYEKGIEVGEKKTWYPNGKLRYQGQMKNGKPFGQWTFFDESGNKTTKDY